MNRIVINKWLKCSSAKVLSCLLVILFLGQAGVSAKDKKNILFIAVDDLKPNLGCYGDKSVFSPHIDKLAERGTVFFNNHCQQAVCAPSRASLLTGLRPDNTKVWDLKTIMRDYVPDVVTLPQYLKQNGYVTVALGKIFDSRSVDKGMDTLSWSVPYYKANKYNYDPIYGSPYSGRWQLPATKKEIEKLSVEADKLNLKNSSKLNYVLGHIKPSTEEADLPDDAYPDGQYTMMAKKCIGELSKGNTPFFLAVGFHKPHLPFTAPKKYWDLYNREDFRLAQWQEKPENGPDIAMHNWEELKSYTDINENIDKSGNLNSSKQLELIHGYYACVSYIDKQIGELIDELQKKDLAQNTIIVLWGDHGWHLGDHGLWCKHSNYEQATRSPLIIVSPEIEGGRKVSSPTEFIDIFPTINELVGLPSFDALEGQSLLPVMEGKTGAVKDYAISQYPRGKSIMGYSLRNDQYRYVEWFDKGSVDNRDITTWKTVAVELYDYQKDPDETKNIVFEESYKAIAENLELEMHKFLEKNSQ